MICRSAAIRPGGARRSNSSRFIWPMPCSAEIDPPAAVTRSWTSAADRRPSRRTSRRRPRPARTWKWTLPSPRWPKPLAMTPGKARFDRLRRGDHEARHVGDRRRRCRGRASGLRPARLRKSNRGSARKPRPAPRWRRSRHRRSGRLAAPRRAMLELGACGSASPLVRRRLDQHMPGVLAGRAAAGAGDMLAGRGRSESPGTSSNPSTWSVLASRKRSRSSAACGSASAGPGDRARGDRRHQLQRRRGDDRRACLRSRSAAGRGCSRDCPS